VGPPATAIEAMGDKVESKKIAEAAGISVIPGFNGVVASAAHAVAVAEDIGYPVMLKASAGGGGTGMRVARDAREVAECFVIATDEAMKSFGDDRLLVEKFVAAPRHIEIQLVADAFGNVACFPERECSVQRRNQKVVEEAPSPFVHARPELRARMQAEAAQLAKAVGYTSAGTVEMLVDATSADFYFLEMNTRLQVEHPVTEAIANEDLVALMLRVADGQALPDHVIGSVPPVGWAVESRIYAEDASRGFVPSTSSLTAYAAPPAAVAFTHAGDVRVDAAVEDGSEVGIHYDPMISKVVTRGATREAALAAARDALDAYVVEGLVHNVPFCRDVCGHAAFRSGDYTTAFIDEHYPAGLDEGKVLTTLPPDTACELACLVVGIDAAARATRGELELRGPQVVVLRAARADAELTLHVDGSDGAYTVLHDGEERAIRLEDAVWAAPLADPLVLSGGRVACQYVNSRPLPGFDHALRVRGVRVDAAMRSPREHALAKHARPAAEEAPLAGLACPMPGTLLSFAVEAGAAVDAGEPLAVVEAMKMQNVLRAETRVVVDELCADVGDVVAADQVLMTFVVGPPN